MSNAVIDAQFEQFKTFGIEICQQMTNAINGIGFSAANCTASPEFEQAEFSLITDPFTLDQNLMGNWFDNNRQRRGLIQFNSDGSFYAEYDIVKPHPINKKLFVEAMSAWGNREQIKTEAKLLPLPGG